mmetsp:Transcript_60332/g.99831  ORF Transcript_60332/g.99831 Transcript_60332/m.99831 type:complete len:89 (-) Transcript_60332:103-369(-)
MFVRMAYILRGKCNYINGRTLGRGWLKWSRQYRFTLHIVHSHRRTRTTAPHIQHCDDSAGYRFLYYGDNLGIGLVYKPLGLLALVFVV